MTLHFQAKLTMLLIIGWTWNFCEKKIIFIWICMSDSILLELDWGEDGQEVPFVPPLSTSLQCSRMQGGAHMCFWAPAQMCVCVHVLRTLSSWNAHSCTVLLPDTAERQEFQVIKAWLAIHCHEGYRGGGRKCQVRESVRRAPSPWQSLLQPCLCP